MAITVMKKSLGRSAFMEENLRYITIFLILKQQKRKSFIIIF